jgi:ubiquinone/menaquinone biosynthesis C-methylase UbiE
MEGIICNAKNEEVGSWVAKNRGPAGNLACEIEKALFGGSGMTRSHANLWQLYARVYDSVILLFLPYRDLTHKVVDRLKPTPGARILDAGCGTGNLIVHLVKTRSDIEVIGIDFSEAMLRRAGKKSKQLRTVTLLDADLNERLPFGDGEFDGITCVNVLYAVDRPAFLLKEVHRVLRTGGIIVLATPIFKTKMSFIFNEHVVGLRRSYAWLWPLVLTIQIARVAPSAILFLLINKFIQEERAFHFFQEEELKALVGECGFHLNSIERVYGEQSWFLVGRKKARPEEHSSAGGDVPE